MISFLSRANEDVGLFEELWNYFVDFFFYPENIYLPNLNFSLGAMVTIRNILIGLILGMIVAAFGIVYTKRVIGAFARKLLAEEIFSPEKAVRLAQTGYVTNFSVRNALKRGNTLRCVVRCREEEEHERAMDEAQAAHEERQKQDPSLPAFVRSAYRVDPDSDHFYIPEEKKYQADMRFDKHGTTWLAFFMMILVSVVLFCVLMVLFPKLLTLLDSYVGSLDKPPSNILS